MANQSFRLKEEQLKKEEEKLKEIELRVQREISEKRQELLAKEESLRNMEVCLHSLVPLYSVMCFVHLTSTEILMKALCFLLYIGSFGTCFERPLGWTISTGNPIHHCFFTCGKMRRRRAALSRIYLYI
jgi:hypothetical protein